MSPQRSERANSIKLNVPAPKIVAIDRVALAVLERTKLPVTASSWSRRITCRWIRPFQG